jgi:protein MpaA
MNRPLVVAGLLAAALAAQAAVAGAARHGVERQFVFGRSVEGRPLVAVELGEPQAAFTAVVVGCIDGDECAGIRIAQTLERLALPSFLDLWLIVDMNPDGRAADTLQNAHGVDLNRNFPWRWRRLGTRGYWQYSGPRSLSEPESRAVYRLLLRLHPRLVVWYHQPLTVVDESGGSIALEREYADLVGLPLGQLTRYPGSATSWADHTFRGSTSFVVELPPGPLPATAAHRHAEAIISIARASAAACHC